ncbi:MAG: pyruvate carboxylase, partial [Crocinitomicaceae bacterium]|nr:pyruvate carboxylase [Crocinitomicaceae bacterium]
SKVVGDMALYMVTNDLTPEEVIARGEEISFPESVVNFFKGDLGQPFQGFPKKLQKLILKDKKSIKERPNQHLEPVNFDEEFASFKKKYQKGFARTIEFEDFLSYKLYPKVFDQVFQMFKKYDNVAVIPTKNFYYGMELGEETIIEIAPGKTVIIQLLSIGHPNGEGYRTIFFKVNGQTRNIEILDKSLNIEKVEHVKVDSNDSSHVGAPLQGLLSKVFVKKGQALKKNDPIFVIEAMKMETTITAKENGAIKSIILKEGTMVNAEDLVVTLS